MDPILEQGKYMSIQLSSPIKKKTYECKITEKGDEWGYLGTIKWYGPWRSYCFFPGNEKVFDKGCTTQILKWMDTLNEHHRKLVKELKSTT